MRLKVAAGHRPALRSLNHIAAKGTASLWPLELSAQCSPHLANNFADSSIRILTAQQRSPTRWNLPDLRRRRETEPLPRLATTCGWPPFAAARPGHARRRLATVARAPSRWGLARDRYP